MHLCMHTCLLSLPAPTAPTCAFCTFLPAPFAPSMEYVHLSATLAPTAPTCAVLRLMRFSTPSWAFCGFCGFCTRLGLPRLPVHACMHTCVHACTHTRHATRKTCAAFAQKSALPAALGARLRSLGSQLAGVRRAQARPRTPPNEVAPPQGPCDVLSQHVRARTLRYFSRCQQELGTTRFAGLRGASSLGRGPPSAAFRPGKNQSQYAVASASSGFLEGNSSSLLQCDDILFSFVPDLWGVRDYPPSKSLVLREDEAFPISMPCVHDSHSASGNGNPNGLGSRLTSLVRLRSKSTVVVHRREMSGSSRSAPCSRSWICPSLVMTRTPT